MQFIDPSFATKSQEKFVVQSAKELHKQVREKLTILSKAVGIPSDKTNLLCLVVEEPTLPPGQCLLDIMKMENTNTSLLGVSSRRTLSLQLLIVLMTSKLNWSYRQKC